MRTYDDWSVTVEYTLYADPEDWAPPGLPYLIVEVTSYRDADIDVGRFLNMVGSRTKTNIFATAFPARDMRDGLAFALAPLLPHEAADREPEDVRYYLRRAAEAILATPTPVFGSPPHDWNALGDQINNATGVTGVTMVAAGVSENPVILLLAAGGSVIYVKIGAPAMTAFGNQLSGLIEDEMKALRARRRQRRKAKARCCSAWSPSLPWIHDGTK